MVGFGVVLAVVGAILKYAVDADTEGFDLNTAGDIMLWAGALLALVGIILYAADYFRDDDLAPVRHRYGRRHDLVDDEVVEEEVTPAEAPLVERRSRYRRRR